MYPCRSRKSFHLFRKICLWFAALACLSWSILGASQRVVLGELFSRDSCPYCPSAARGFVDLVDTYGYDQFVPIAWWMPGYPENIPEGSARADMYGVPGVPHAWFDGFEDSLGGLPSGSMFQYYNPIVSSHLGQSSALEISAYYSLDGDDLTLIVHIEVTEAADVSEAEVHFIVCEFLEVGTATPQMVNIARLALPSEPFVLSEPGQSMDVERTATLSPSWTEPISIVVFVQNHGDDYDVLQAVLADDVWSGDTIDVTYGCAPDSGVLPFTTSM